MEEKLRKFLTPYIGKAALKKDDVRPEDVEMLLHFASYAHVEQEIIDYGTAHPEAHFWDFHKLIPPPTPEQMQRIQKELDEDDED